jgi:hypothetical protein
MNAVELSRPPTVTFPNLPRDPQQDITVATAAAVTVEPAPPVNLCGLTNR